MSRCPACGHRLEPSTPRRCPLCRYDFEDDRATGADVTPYADSFSQGRRGLFDMAEWIWYAGSGRLKHLALMRDSAAARRFALIHVLLFSSGLGLFAWTVAGWHWVGDPSRPSASGFAKPIGAGWFHLASAAPLAESGASSDVAIALWWNPAQTMIAMPTAFILAFLLSRVALCTLQIGVTLAHERAYRHEQRLTAALLYGTAWTTPLTVSALILTLRPISYLGSIAGWKWIPSDRAFVVVGAVLAGFGATMWWFWLFRLGVTAPANTKSRVVSWLTLGSPLIAVGAATGWWYAFSALGRFTTRALDLGF